MRCFWRHYATHYSQKYNLPAKRLSASLTDKLSNWSWPGNVRALRHAVERAVILSEGEVLGLADFPFVETETPQEPAVNVSRLDTVERDGHCPGAGKAQE